MAAYVREFSSDDRCAEISTPIAGAAREVCPWDFAAWHSSVNFEEEMDLLRCHQDLLEAADCGTSSEGMDYEEPSATDDDMYFPTRVVNMVESVIEEKEPKHRESAQMWAQSLLRLKRSMDEIQCLCEFEQDDECIAEVQRLLEKMAERFQRLRTLPPIGKKVDSATMTDAQWPLLNAALLEPSNDDQVRTPVSRTSGNEAMDTPVSRGVASDAIADGRRSSTGEHSHLTAEPELSQLFANDPFDLNAIVQKMIAYQMRVQKRFKHHIPKRGEDLRNLAAERQRRAEQRREDLNEIKSLKQHRVQENRMQEAKQRRAEMEQKRQEELDDKLAKAKRNYQEQMSTICQRARTQIRKSEEVAYIQKERVEGERESLERKHEKAGTYRSKKEEKMRQQLLQAADRIQAVADRKRHHDEMWKSKISQDLSEKQLQAAARRQETMNAMKERMAVEQTKLESSRCRKKELQVEENLQANIYIKNRGKVIYRLGFDVDDLPEGTKTEVSKGIMSSSPRIDKPVSPKPCSKTVVHLSKSSSLVKLARPRSESPLWTVTKDVADSSTDAGAKRGKCKKVARKEKCYRTKVKSETSRQETSSPSQNARRSYLRNLLDSKERMSDEDAIKLLETVGKPCANRVRILKMSKELKQAYVLYNGEPTQCDFGAVREINKLLEGSRGEQETFLLVSSGVCAILVDLMTATAHAPQTFPLFMDCLKGIGLLTKGASCRQFFVLTNKVQQLGDCAISLLQAGMQEDDSEASVTLCLSQLFLVLLQVVKQDVPPEFAEAKRMQCEHILLSGLSECLTTRFIHVGMRGMRIFDSSPLPLFLLRATEFLANVVQVYRGEIKMLELEGRRDSERIVASVDNTEISAVMRRTEIFALVPLLSNILLADGHDRHLSPTALSLCLQVVRVLVAVAHIDVKILQETFAGHRMHEFSHLLGCIVDCTGKFETGEGADVLHDVIHIIGYYILLRSDNQAMMRMKAGISGRNLLTKLICMPMRYFIDIHLRDILYPILLSAVFREPSNLEIMKEEMDPHRLTKYIREFLDTEDAGYASRIPFHFPAALMTNALDFLCAHVPENHGS